jgi:hypothetical protein
MIMEYDEKDICKKCGNKLKSNKIKYEYFHDGGMYEDSYRQVDRNFAKKVGLDFYCNNCYDNIGNSDINEIIKQAYDFLEVDLKNAINEVREHFEEKMKQLLEIQVYIEKGLDFLKDKDTLSELTKDELKYLLEYCSIYEPNYQKIKVGFSPFILRSEVRALLEAK